MFKFVLVKTGLLIGLLSVILLGYGGVCTVDTSSGNSSSGSSGIEPPVNRAPVLAAIGDKTIAEGETLAFNISATDPDGDALTYLAYDQPAGSVFSSNSRSFSWTPTFSQAGVYSTPKFKVTDVAGLSDEETITITVTDVAGPTTPTNLAAQIVSYSQINLSWTDNSTNEAGFRVERKTAGIDAYRQIAVVLPNTTAYSDTGLSSSATYYYRVCAYSSANNNGPYSNEVSATTTALELPPSILSNYLTNVNDNSAIFYGSLNPNGLATTAYFQYGITATYGSNTATQTMGNGTVSINITANITGLTQATTYYFRLVATNSAGTAYGQGQVFNTSRTAVLPVVNTGSAVTVTYNAANLNGTVNPGGFAGSGYFQYGITPTAYTNNSTSQDLGSVTSAVSVSINVTGLSSNNTYYYRIVGNNDCGTTFGIEQNFTTISPPPTTTTDPATDVVWNGASLNGSVNPNGLASTAYFEYGTSTAYGANTATENISASSGTVSITAALTSLVPNTTYHFRTVGTNSSGTNYGADRAFTTPINTDWGEIMSGATHTVGIKNNGTLWAWGDNEDGQLGLGNYVSKTSPTQVGTDSNWSKAACGYGFTIALKSNGTLWAWGDNASGELGLGSAITSTNVPAQVGTDNNWTKIAAGGMSHTVAVKSTGQAYAWGGNDVGQLGLGDSLDKYTPTLVTDTSISSVSCGYDSTTLITTDGKMFGAGNNASGQLGLGGSVITQTSLAQIGADTDWAEAAGGGAHTIARKTNGLLYGTGRNLEGELGLGDVLTRTSFSKITDTAFADISVGFMHNIAKKADGTIFAWGDNEFGELGLGDLLTRTAPTLITETGWSIISAGWAHTIGVKEDNSFYGWGYNEAGQLGLGDNNDRNAPVQPPSPSSSWVEVVAGLSHTLARKPDGTLWSWGNNYDGELGLGNSGTGTNRLSPVQVGTETNWKQIAAGWASSFALKTNDTLWAWGNNSQGQLGLGSIIISRMTPTQVGTDTNWQKVANHYSHALALKTDGTLYAWGWNNYGELGLGDQSNRYTPTMVGVDTNWQKIDTYLHSLSIKTNSTLWVWGDNNDGQLGLGDTTQRTSPVQVGTDTNWQKISAGYSHTLAIKTDGTLWAWGNNWYGKLGLGDTTNRLVPTQVGTNTNWQTVVAGPHHSLAIKTDGTLWAWGYNLGGQLGLGDTTYRTSPVQVGTDSNWQIITISTGYMPGGYNLAIKTNGTLWGWGDNSAGQLGLGDTTVRLVPTRVP